MANPLRKDIIFSDFKTNLSTHPVTGDLAMATNEAAVNQSIRNLILSNYGERPFEYEIASGVPDTLFELISPQTTSDLRYAIKECLDNFEPRIEVLYVGVQPYEEFNEYRVSIQYRLKSNMSPYTFTLSISRLA
jgi:phage baseplate assembly protein W